MKGKLGDQGAELAVLEAVEVDTTAIQSNQVVPAQNSADNVLARDVIGNKTDNHTGDSLYSKANTNDEHNHGVNMLYPVLASPVTLTKAAGVYAVFPTPTEIIPAGMITDDFDIHWAIISDISANGDCDKIIRKKRGSVSRREPTNAYTVNGCKHKDISCDKF
ncbi:MAG: hypothetical protein GWP06_00260 [Actinobacteria bacterium]|nr:hypothetical protein [Actinomycetota bacterium]